MADKKASEKKATDAKATNAKTTGAKAAGAKASGASARNTDTAKAAAGHTSATPGEGNQDTARAAATKVVDSAADAIKTAARTAPDADAGGPARPEIGDGSFDHTPTATQITTEAAFPNATEKFQEPKHVRFDTPPGVSPTGATPTTIKEEVRLLDPETMSGDDAKDNHTMQVLAQTQGINQAVESKGGVKVVLQTGEVREDKLPDVPDAAKETEKPE